METEKFDKRVEEFKKQGLNAGEAYAKAKDELLTEITDICNQGEILAVECLLDIRALLHAQLNLQLGEALSTKDPKYR